MLSTRRGRKQKRCWIRDAWLFPGGGEEKDALIAAPTGKQTEGEQAGEVTKLDVEQDQLRQVKFILRI